MADEANLSDIYFRYFICIELLFCWPVATQAVILEEKIASGNIAAEYESLLRKRPPADCRIALRPENASRNRFPNIVPYEDSRVKLIPTTSNPFGYINANHITVHNGTTSLRCTLCYTAWCHTSITYDIRVYYNRYHAQDRQYVYCLSLGKLLA